MATPLRLIHSDAPKPQAEVRTLKEFINKMIGDYDSLNAPHRLRRYVTMANCELYFKGEQLRWFNPRNMTFEPLSTSPNVDEKDLDLYFISNIILPFTEMLAAEYSKSKPKLVPWSEAAQDKHVQGGLEAARHLINCWMDTLWSPMEQQREFKNCMFHGGVLTETKWNPDIGAKIPQGRTGGIESNGIDWYSVEIWDRAVSPEDSPYLHYQRIVHKQDAKYRLGLDSIKGSGESKGIDGLMFKRQLELAVGNTGEADAQSATLFGSPYRVGSGITDDLTCRESHHYFEVVNYFDYRLIQDEKIPGLDQIVPRGTLLKDVFPDDLEVTMINGEHVKYENKKKNATWGGYNFILPATGWRGVGIENMLAQQDWYNEAVSQITASMAYASAGLNVYDANRVQGPFKVRPGEMVPMADILPGESLEQLFKHYDIGGVDVNLLKFPDFIKESMQFTSLARNSQVNGSPGEGLNTAHGVANMQSNADMFSSTKTELRAWNLARRMEQALQLFHDHHVYPRYFSRLGETEGRMLQALDIPEDIHVRVEPDSHMPITIRDRQQDAAAAVDLGVGTGTLKPEIENYLEDIFNLPTEINAADDWEIIGQDRIDTMVATLELAQGVAQQHQLGQQASQFIVDECVRSVLPPPETVPNDPQAVAMGEPAQIEQQLPDVLDDDDALLKFYADYYRSDYYKKQPEEIKAAIHHLVMLHKANLVRKQQEGGTMQIAANQPMEDKQKEMQQEQMGQAQQMEQQKAEQQQQLEAAKAGGNEVDPNTVLSQGHDAGMTAMQQVEAEKTRRHEIAVHQLTAAEKEKERKHQLAMAKARPVKPSKKKRGRR